MEVRIEELNIKNWEVGDYFVRDGKERNYGFCKRN